MNNARIKFSFRDGNPAGLPIKYYTYGKLLSNSTLLISLGTEERDVEITCTREWAEDFVRKIQSVLDEQTELEPEIPPQSASSPLA